MEKNPPKKKKLIYLFGYSFFILFWIIVICLSLELFERLRWKHIEKTNKFVRIRRGELLIKEWDEGREEGIQYGEGKYLSPPQYLYVGDEGCEPEPDPLEMWSYRFHIYFQEDETFQSAFRTIYDIKQFRVDINKTNRVVTCSPISPDMEESKNFPKYLPIIKNIPIEYLQSGRAFLWEESIQEEPHQLFFYPIYDNMENYTFFTFTLPFRGKEGPINPWLGKLSVNELWNINYFSYIPHLNSTEMLFRTNNFGFRDRDIKVPKPEGIFRILCIGASTTEEGVSNQETYPKFLEQELQKHFGKNRIEVFNCGVSGMFLKKHCAKLPDYLYLQPDLVILYEGVNDIIYELLKNSYEKSFFAKKLNYLNSDFVRRNNLYFSSALKTGINYYLAKYLNSISVIHYILLKHNTDLCIASIAFPAINRLNKEEKDYYDYYYEKEWGGISSTFQQYCDVMKTYNQQLKNYCKKNGILYIPIAENIPANTKYFGDICHMRQEGVKLKAKIMAETLTPYLEKVLAPLETATASSE